jgi:outer membrane protein assembly factor BamB
MRMLRAIILLATLLGPVTGFAANWPQWRGPAGNGSATETDLPDSCDPAQAKWTAALPGPSHATPVVWGERIFLTSTERATKSVLALCLNATDGKILWQQRLGDDIKAPQNNGATPSPVTDGQRVWFLLGNGELVALDADGKPLWKKNLVADHGNLCTKFGYSSSPLLWNDKLYVQMLRRSKPYSGPPGIDQPLDSLVLALDPLTGKELWQHVRKTESVDESCESYTTPVAFENSARKELLIQGGDCISGHDPATGTDHDSGRVDQPDTTVGTQGAVDRRRVVEHPVHDHARGRGLLEAGGFAGFDRELVPVDDGAVAVGHRQDVAGLIEGRRSIDYRGIDRIRQHRAGNEAGGDGRYAKADRRG